ncbi:Nuclear receptor 2C2-associated protein [Geranomyces variabilis]|uniref:Nuclear receptor 2C2-associated protein n=1 Tax=Geranomyces variabilis TaxID=109894 RepID=A0AAD5TNQ6_9FUNG|nr:Nuclear receptor 2C2-associated protein [Geranomyces variabilis]
MTAPSALIAGAQIRVSSTLNRDVRSYGKQFLTDGSDETCWNSDQGSPQHITIHFADNDSAALAICELHLMFQGGFAGKECTLLGQSATATTDAGDDNNNNSDSAAAAWETLLDFYPVDANHLQVFAAPDAVQTKTWKRLRVLFKTSTDFYGRITVYRLDVRGLPR